MKKLICALIGAAALVASATTYIQTSTTGTAPWKPVKDSVSQAHLADSARVAWFAHAATYADSSRVSGLSDSAKRAETASWTPLSDSSLASGIADSAKKAGTASNSLALGGIAASQYGTLAQDTLIAKKVASDTATVLRAGIASAVTTSEAYATARISDSLSANTRGWTTLAAAKSSIHDSLAVERTFDTAVARNVVHDSMLYRDTAYLLRRSDTSYVTWGSPFVPSMGWFWGVGNNARMTVLRPDELLMRHRDGGPWARLLFNTYDNEYGRYLRITGSQFGYDSSCGLQVNGPVSATSFSGNATTATKLATARTIGMSGDVTGAATAFDGSANITIPTTLPTLLTAGSAGSATSVPTLKWDAKGRLTSVVNVPISIPHTQISDWTSAVSNVYLPLSGGTMYGNLLGGTSYNIGSWSNWWGSIYATTIYESNVALSSKYLGINASISHTQISDWNTYINQPLLTTSSPTFATVTGNLTGHASLDIPLTGSNAITGNLTPGNDALYDLGSGALQWNNIRGKTIYENGSQLANVYASLGSDNTYTGIQNTHGIVSDGNFFLRGFLSLNPFVETTNAARTIDVSMCNIVIYTVQQQYVQTLPDGTYSGQILIVKNAQNVSGVTFGGKIAPGATLVPERNTSIFVWNSNSNRWE